MSEFTCPECNAEAPEGTKAGVPYACPQCGNPTLPVRRRVRVAPPAPTEPPAAARPAWKIALLAFFVLGAAYLGVYELLTAEAKKERDRLFAAHGAAITTFPDPGAAPTAGDPALLQRYRASLAQFEDRSAYESRVSRIDTMFTALMLAFGAQSVFTAIVLAKTALRAK